MKRFVLSTAILALASSLLSSYDVESPLHNNIISVVEAKKEKKEKKKKWKKSESDWKKDDSTEWKKEVWSTGSEVWLFPSWKWDLVKLRDGNLMPLSGLGMCCRPSAHGEEWYKSVLNYLNAGGRWIDTARMY